MEPSPIFARAKARRSPPAAISSRTAREARAKGVRSPANLKMLVGVRTKGITIRPIGVDASACTFCPVSPRSRVKVV